ncbi:MAG: hypothetical protein Q4P08_02505 [Eubacteriales bacterium]|nr:hypothetical protein [Eubacteriales bacterium]
MSYYALLPCLFGIEAALKNELLDLGYSKSDLSVDDGLVKVKLGSDWVSELFKLNLELRTAERVRLELFTAEVSDFDAYFELVKSFNWQDWIRPGEAFTINGSSRKSKLFGVPALQSLAKKAIVESLLKAWNLKGQLAEDKKIGEVRINFAFNQDQLSFSLDTSGEGLHKRGYRPLNHSAPLRETVAAAILYYAHYKNVIRFNEKLYDPFCGSGTFLVEAASILSNKAPGLDRSFAMERANFAQPVKFARLRTQAKRLWQPELIKPGLINGSDLYASILQDAEQNLSRAGFKSMVDLRQRDFLQLTAKGLDSWPQGPGLLVANPPYGERLGEVETALELTEKLLAVGLDSKLNEPWQLAFIQAAEGAEEICKAADRKRKLYNGSIQVKLYQYFKHSQKR